MEVPKPLMFTYETCLAEIKKLINGLDWINSTSIYCKNIIVCYE